MNQFIKRLIIYLMFFLFVSLFVFGCASTGSDEEEGGISGTGNAINCEDEKYRKHKLCKQH